jgi:acyl-CoA thioester hydrolase
MTSKEFKARFQHTIPVSVAWSDMDALAHVNNANYFTYFETARIDFLQQFEHLLPMPRVGVGPILAYIECQFLRPLTFPDEIFLGSSVVDVGNTSLKLEQEILSVKLEDVVARSMSVLVLIDYGTGEKIRVPDAVRRFLQKG